MAIYKRYEKTKQKAVKTEVEKNDEKSIIVVTERGETMSGLRSKRKGSRGELELAKKLNEYGFDCRRSQQYCGVAGDADVIGLAGIFIESKRVEKLNLYAALEQAQADAKGEMPVVMHRRNHKEWVVIQPLEDWIELYKAWRDFQEAQMKDV